MTLWGVEGDWGKQSFIVIHEFFHIASLGSKEHLHGMVAWMSKEGLAELAILSPFLVCHHAVCDFLKHNVHKRDRFNTLVSGHTFFYERTDI